MTGPSTVAWAGSISLALMMQAEDGMIIGRNSEMKGNKEDIMKSDEGLMS